MYAIIDTIVQLSNKRRQLLADQLIYLPARRSSPCELVFRVVGQLVLPFFAVLQSREILDEVAVPSFEICQSAAGLVLLSLFQWLYGDRPGM